MALTDNCDIFASFHEEGFNRIIEHFQRQRPSLFNYGTLLLAQNPRLLCQPIEAHPIVGIRRNPLITLVDPLTVPGTNFGVNFSVQIGKVLIDFHPGNRVNLPPELSPPLKDQRIAIGMQVCIGFGCPPKDIVDRLIPPPDKHDPKLYTHGRGQDIAAPPRRDIIVLPTRELICFCLDVYAIGGVRTRTYGGKPYLEPFIDGLEIVDIRPNGLENSLECFLQLLIKLSLLPKLRILLKDAAFDLLKDVLTVKLMPMPTSAALPNNPAIEQDQLKAFIKVEVV